MKHIKKILGASLLAMGLLLCIGTQPAQAGPVLKIDENAWLMINYETQLYGQWRNTGSGPDMTSDTADLWFRRNRLTLLGQANDTYGFVLAIQQQGENRIEDIKVSNSRLPSTFDVLDAFLRADFTDYFRVRAGLTKDQLVREDLEGCFDPLSVDRSLFVYTDIPRLNRDYGVIVWGNLLDAKLQYRLAAMRGDDTGANPKSNLRYTARVHLTLLDPESSLVYRGTYLGAKKVLTFGAGYQYQPDVVFGNLAVTTGATSTLPKDYQAWTLDEFFEYPTTAGTFTLSAAYLDESFNNAYEGGNPDPRSVGENGQKKGWYSKAGYLLPKKIGPGQVQVYGRYEQWKFAELTAGTFNQKVDWAAGGVNYLLKGQDLRVTLEYSNTHFGVQDVANPLNTRNFSTLTAMLQARF
jgi:hypothetical protein